MRTCRYTVIALMPLIAVALGGCGESEDKREKATQLARKACIELIKRQNPFFEDDQRVSNVSSDPTDDAFEFNWQNATCKGFSDRHVITDLHIGDKTLIRAHRY